ncbi:MAG TPA: hypothetical protein VJY33_04420, partial [Isosphaeraceae bacterium]|nr:hypothetical protein [Isosphaeraceae bacterium]
VAGNWASLILRSNEANAKVAVSFRLRPKPQTVEATLKEQLERSAKALLAATVLAFGQKAASVQNDPGECGAVVSRLAAE